MGSLEDRIQINFGQTEFLFNVKAKVNELQKQIFDEICEQPQLQMETDFAQELVRDYLRHSGYT